MLHTRHEKKGEKATTGLMLPYEKKTSTRLNVKKIDCTFVRANHIKKAAWTFCVHCVIVCFCRDIQLFNGHIDIPNRKINFENIFFICYLMVIAWNSHIARVIVQAAGSIARFASICAFSSHRWPKWLCLSVVLVEKSALIFSCLAIPYIPSWNFQLMGRIYVRR